MGTLKASFHFYSSNIEYLMLLSFSILLPFIRYVWNDVEGEEKKLGPAYLIFLNGFTSVWVCLDLCASNDDRECFIYPAGLSCFEDRLKKQPLFFFKKKNCESH